MGIQDAKTDRAVLITFILGIISIIYFIASISLLGSDPMLAGIPESYLSWMILERLILIGIIILILILLTYILMKQRSFEETRRERPSPVEDKAEKLRREKAIREDIRRYYRDMGALKIVLKDGVLDPKTYNERKKYLEDMIRIKKKGLQKLKE